MHRVFVYGTLKQHYGNHRLLANSLYMGKASTLNKFRMLDGGFPVVMDTDLAKAVDERFAGFVTGEVYLVDDATLARLNQLEGEGVMYDRKTVMVRMPFMLDPGMDFTVRREVSIYIGCERYWSRGGWRDNHVMPNAAGLIDWQREHYKVPVIEDDFEDDVDFESDDDIAEAHDPSLGRNRKGW